MTDFQNLYTYDISLNITPEDILALCNVPDYRYRPLSVRSNKSKLFKHNYEQ